MTQPTTGHVALVGAGPGDADLLTRRAVRAIRAATVVLADDLVSDAVLRFVRRSARIVHVGKRGGCASTPQAFIEKLMAAEALKGERVVRLKGGDPFIFGRGGEEAEHLRALSIEVEIVNGITSGLAAATALGAPLTHREHAHGVIFVTAHSREGGAPLDWPTLGAAAAQGLTLVIYMGVAAIETVQRGLLQAMPGHTPGAVVQSVSLPQQRHAVCTLATLAKTTRDEALASPSIIIVGNVLQGIQTLAQSREQERAA
ncbi:MAG: uroporphyrinogen-III C-methyltransferase [Burkholderiaceae bacterium]